MLPIVQPGGDLTAEQLERGARNIALPELGVDGQRRLRAARVLVVGAGGLGSPVLQYLAAAGVGTIGIVDFDSVDRSNLQRQVIHAEAAIGELKTRSAARAIGALDPTIDFMESHIVPTILIYHLGVDINKGLNAGDRCRIEADSAWADNYDGNVHLGLDAEKLWVAWERGRAMSENVYSGHWDFWAHIATPLSELRNRWSIPDLDPALAAVEDDAVSRGDFERSGMPEPPAVSSTPIADRPPAPGQGG